MPPAAPCVPVVHPPVPREISRQTAPPFPRTYQGDHALANAVLFGDLRLTECPVRVNGGNDSRRERVFALTIIYFHLCLFSVIVLHIYRCQRNGCHH